MFARNFLNTLIKNQNSLMITRSQLKNQIPSRFASSNVEVKHNPEEEIFYIDINNSRAYIEYAKSGNVVKLLSTFVPRKLRGKDLGKILAHETFTYVKDNDLKMEIECSFLQHYLDKYGEEFEEYVKK